MRRARDGVGQAHIVFDGNTLLKSVCSNCLRVMLLKATPERQHRLSREGIM